MKTHMPKPTDLRAPGAVDQLLAFHRAVFGDTRMDANDGGDAGSGAGDAGTGAGDANGGSGTAGTGDAGNDGQAGAQGSQPGAAEKVEDLPEWAQKQIRDLRKEAGDRRGEKNAAEQKLQQTLEGIGKALGLKTDDEKPDPAELTKQLTTAQVSQRQTAVELAVYKTASKHSGDPDALLDSRTFLAKVKDLDPSASDFASKVDEAIKSALADNPKLKAARAAGSSSADHAGGSGEGANRPKSLGDAVAGHYGK